VTPLDKAREFLDSLVGLAPQHGVVLPVTQYAQLATPVISCEALIIGVANTDPHPDYGGTSHVAVGISGFTCNASQRATFLISLSRECSWVSADDGTDIPEEVVKVSEKMQADHDLLWYFAADLDDYLSKSWSINMTLMGGLAITTLMLATGVD
jgi:hypothetical protein